MEYLHSYSQPAWYRPMVKGSPPPREGHQVPCRRLARLRQAAMEHPPSQGVRQVSHQCHQFGPLRFLPQDPGPEGLGRFKRDGQAGCLGRPHPPTLLMDLERIAMPPHHS